MFMGREGRGGKEELALKVYYVPDTSNVLSHLIFQNIMKWKLLSSFYKETKAAENILKFPQM